MRTPLTGINAVLLLCVLAACAPKPIKVPPGFTALEDTNLAPLPTGTADDPYPEKINTVKGHNDDDGYDWAHGQAYIHASIEDVWTALQDPCVVTKHEDIDKYCVLSPDPDVEAQVSYSIHFWSKPFLGSSTDFEAGWRQFATKGTEDAPTEVVSRDDLLSRVEKGPLEVMTTVSDSVILTKVNSNVTAVSHIRHLQVLSQGPDEAAGYVKTLFDNLVNVLHGGDSLCGHIVGAGDASLQCH